MYGVARPVLFRLDPERAHELSVRAMQAVGSSRALARVVARRYHTATRPTSAFGLEFRNPVGVAAGYDKDAVAFRGLASLGFGHVEVGTVTPRPQPGNPRPRVFRLPADRGVINRLGFPSRGADFVAAQLTRPRPDGLVVGVNIGKNKETPLDVAGADYVALLRQFSPLADYLVINVSSPNTEGLRRLQGRAALDRLLGPLIAARAETPRAVPLLVKLSPDLDSDALDDALGAILDHGLDGIVATNTTTSRDGLKSRHAHERGGLSGAPLRARSVAMVADIVARTGGAVPVIAVGGIGSADDAQRQLDAGAVLVQVYTAMIYEGPGIARRIVEGLR